VCAAPAFAASRAVPPISRTGRPSSLAAAASPAAVRFHRSCRTGLPDGVDERQVARALALAAEVTDEEHMQYIVTLNTDTLSTAAQRGFDPEPHISSPRLTDDEEGGLFGFRFKAAGKA
jgi:hypothetical protein